jgi:hypothetical protein
MKSHSSKSNPCRLSSIIAIIVMSLLIFYIVVFFHVFSNPLSGNIPDMTALKQEINEKASKLMEMQHELANLYDTHNKLDVAEANLKSKDAQIQNLRGQLDANDNIEELKLENVKLKAVVESYSDINKRKKAEIDTLEKELESLRKGEAPAGGAASEQQIYRPGVVVLGMHRSGTSTVGGLMNQMGLKTGGPLIQANFDNEKGFFERIDVVLQNDYIMREQQVHYAANTYKYDALRGLKDALEKKEDNFFSEGRRALKFLNDPNSYPWMLKDPRLCITFRTWLPLLNFIPAVLFTYRNPMDVALSMHNRETEHFPIARGLKLWYIYNKRAIQGSFDLCRVVTNHRLVMKQPEVEMQKVFDGLRSCGVPVPHALSSEAVKSFIDTSLQHGRTSVIDDLCRALDTDFSKIIPPAESWVTTEEAQLKLYRSSVRAYCDMETGKAFKPDYKWDETVKDN